MNSIRTPLLRGYFIKKYDAKTNSFFNTLDLSDKGNILEDYLNELKNTFKIFFPEKIQNADALKLFNDLYVLLTYSSISIPWKNMLQFWLKRNFQKLINVNEFLENQFINFSRKTNELYKTFPADFRPGLNASSLLIHLLTTSSLASCLYIQDHQIENWNSLDFQVLRFASLFHDIGNPFSNKNKIRDPKKTVELLNIYFKDLISENLITGITTIINEYDNESPSSELSKYLKEGKKISYTSEYFKDYLINLFSKEINLSKENYDDPAFWESILDNNYLHLTKVFLKDYKKNFSRGETEDMREPENKEIALIRGDVRHIHEYIDHVKTLTELRNSSRLLDYVLTVDIVDKLISSNEFKIIPENLLYSSGGNIILFSAAEQADQILDYLEEIFYSETRQGVMMAAEATYINRNFTGSFGDLYSKIAIKIGSKKNSLQGKISPVIPGSAKLCESCDKNVAVNFNRKEEKEYCVSCNYKYKLEDPNKPELENISIQNRWKNIIRPRFSRLLKNCKWKDISDNVMNFIAGVPFEKIDECIYYPEKEKDLPSAKLAVINADGNLMGEFIAQSATLSDLFSRVIHISNSILEIFDDIETMLIDKFGEDQVIEDLIRLDLGKIYIGGDDILILTPGYLSLPIVLTLTKEFYKKMGKKTLSSGIFLCPPKFPVWTAIETSRKLLNKKAKKKGRFHEKNKLGALDFQTNISGTDVDIPDDLSIFSRRPYRIYTYQDNSSKIEKNDFQYLLNIILGSDYHIDYDLNESYTDLYEFIYDEKENDFEIIKDLRNKIKRIQSFFSISPEEFSNEKRKAIAFILYQRVRQNQEQGKESYMKLYNLIGDHDSDESMLLFDGNEVIKFLSGGEL